MSNFIEYRPHLKYERELDPKLDEIKPVEPTEQGEKLLSDPNIKVKDFLKKAESAGYLPSLAVMEAMEITGVDVLENLALASQLTNSLIQEILGELQGELANSMSIDDYIKGRENQDIELMIAFEDFHCHAIEGNTMAETLPLLLDLRDELDLFLDYANQELFQGRASLDNLDNLRRKEDAQLKHIIEQDQQGQADLSGLSEDNHFKYYLHAKASVTIEFVQGMQSTLKGQLNDRYGGKAADLIQTMAATPQIVQSIQDSMESRFHKQVADCQDAKERMMRIASTPMKFGILTEMRAQQKKKIQNETMIKWMEENSPESDSDPLNLLYIDILQGVNAVSEDCELLVQDAYKLIELEQMQLGDYMDALYAKKSSRDLYRLTKHIQDHFDFDSGDADKQAERMLRHSKL